MCGPHLKSRKLCATSLMGTEVIINYLIYLENYFIFLHKICLSVIYLPSFYISVDSYIFISHVG